MKLSTVMLMSPSLLVIALALPLAAPSTLYSEDVAAVSATTPTVVPPTAVPEGLLLLEFRGARLGQVLDYLSLKAGFIIVNPVELPAPITLVARTPVTPAEAVEALNSVIITQNFAAVVRGRSLYIVPLGSARQQNLPVIVGSDPDKIPESDTMVTQVMPVQFAGVKELADSLTPLLNTATTTLSINESSNTILLTGTQTQIRRIAAIIKAIDGSISGEQQVKVFHLRHASADKVAAVINSIYGNRSSGGGGSRGNTNDQFQRFLNQGGGRGIPNGANQSAGPGNQSAGRTVEVSAAADTGTNSLVIRASPAAMTALADMVRDLDVDTNARDGVLLYRVKNGKAADLAKSLNDLFQGATSQQQNRNNATQNRTGGSTTLIPQARAETAASGSGDEGIDLDGQVRVTPDATSNSVLVLTSERNFPRLEKILVLLDQPMRQVLVRVLVAEVTVDNGLDIGVQLDGIGPAIDPTSRPLPTGTGNRAFTDFNLFDSTLGVSGYIIESSRMRAAIRALASTTTFDVLTRPYILTTDNRQAIVNVSQEVPVITGSRTDANNNITSTFDRRDVGIILKVTPQINSEGSVVLDVNQELSALSDQTIPVAKDVPSPIIKKRTMNTRVMVQNGQTVIVGGLVSDTRTVARQKVPLLGDIPFIGVLFRRSIEKSSKTELLVFLTPQVVNEPGQLTDLGQQLRAEMKLLDAAVEPGVFARHLQHMSGLKVGESILPGGKFVAFPALSSTTAAVPVPNQSGK